MAVASRLDTGRAFAKVLLPTLAKGVIVRSVVLLLDPADAARLPAGSPSPFALATREEAAPACAEPGRAEAGEDRRAGTVTMRAPAIGGPGQAGIRESARLWPTTLHHFAQSFDAVDPAG